MKRKNHCSAAILLLNPKMKTENSVVKKWFEESRFRTHMATDIFQALEIISDYTVRQSPEVILLDIDSFAKDFPDIYKIVTATTLNEKVLIMALSEAGKSGRQQEYFEGNFAQVKTELDKLMPNQAVRFATGRR